MLKAYGIDSRTFKKSALFAAGALAWMLMVWQMTA